MVSETPLLCQAKRLFSDLPKKCQQWLQGASQRELILQLSKNIVLFRGKHKTMKSAYLIYEILHFKNQRNFAFSEADEKSKSQGYAQT
jgi:hypothetical protein